jgi:hypothetical protein
MTRRSAPTLSFCYPSVFFLNLACMGAAPRLARERCPFDPAYDLETRGFSKAIFCGFEGRRTRIFINCVTPKTIRNILLALLCDPL